MTKLTVWDAAIIGAYFVLIIFAGLYCHRRAAQNMDDYFLGGRKLPWWLLALLGTMWQVSVLVLFGFRSFNIQWMWAFLTGAFLMSFMARWIRRTGVLTAAQLNRGQDNLRLIALNTLLGMAALFSLYLIPLYLIGHWFQWFAISTLVCAAAIAARYRTWYRRLEDEEPEVVFENQKGNCR